MDPNATLKEIRELCESMSEADEYDSKGIDQNDAYRLVCLMESLDCWLCKKGFLPDDWNR